MGAMDLNVARRVVSEAIGMMSVKLVNLTPHPLTIILANGQALTLQPPPDTPTPRVEDAREADYSLVHDDYVVRTNVVTPGDVMNLPEPQPGVVLIVSRITAEAAPDRGDLYFPDELVRDAKGQTTGCKALGRLPEVR